MMDDPWIVMRFWELGILCGFFFFLPGVPCVLLKIYYWRFLIRFSNLVIWLKCVIYNLLMLVEPFLIFTQIWILKNHVCSFQR